MSSPYMDGFDAGWKSARDEQAAQSTETMLTRLLETARKRGEVVMVEVDVTDDLTHVIMRPYVAKVGK